MQKYGPIVTLRWPFWKKIGILQIRSQIWSFWPILRKNIFFQKNYFGGHLGQKNVKFGPKIMFFSKNTCFPSIMSHLGHNVCVWGGPHFLIARKTHKCGLKSCFLTPWRPPKAAILEKNWNFANPIADMIILANFKKKNFFQKKNFFSKKVVLVAILDRKRDQFVQIMH